MSRPEQNIITHVEEGIIVLPPPSAEERIGIRRVDWNRIKRLISDVPSETKICQIIYTILFSTAGALGVSLIPIHSNPNLAPWVFPLYMWFAIFSLFVAVVFCFLSKREQQARTDRIQNIQTDIEEIENAFETVSDESEPTAEESPEETSESE